VNDAADDAAAVVTKRIDRSEQTEHHVRACVARERDTQRIRATHWRWCSGQGAWMRTRHIKPLSQTKSTVGHISKDHFAQITYYVKALVVSRHSEESDTLYTMRPPLNYLCFHWINFQRSYPRLLTLMWGGRNSFTHAQALLALAPDRRTTRSDCWDTVTLIGRTRPCDYDA
jgi:hypothetical protein